jgi:hypothetical protein
MGQVLIAPRAELLELELSGGIAAVFFRRVVAPLALSAF